MNVLHVHTRDRGGGGAKMVSLINKNLNRKKNISSKMLVGNKSSDSETIREFHYTLPEKAFTHLIERVLSLNGLGSFRSFSFRSIINSNNIDVVHLHNIHGKYFNFLNLLLVPEATRVVWTFHDIWPLTGGCTYSYDCTKFKTNCGECPELRNYPSMLFDNTSLLHKMKMRVFNNTEITVAAPSQWMIENINESKLAVNGLHHVANGINTTDFRPRDTTDARSHFGISHEAAVLLFAANNIDNPQKGMPFLISALQQLSTDRDDIELLVIGGDAPILNQIPSRYEVHAPGYIPEKDLSLAYSAADLCVVPSKMESFGLVATESMACETPVVAFDVGGLSEQITDDTGWLVTPYDTEELAAVIGSALSNSHLETKGKNARERVVEKYGIERCVNRYATIYRRIVN